MNCSHPARGILPLLYLIFCAADAQSWQVKRAPLETRWTALVTPQAALPEYPRPQMVRKHWINLNGIWDYAITSVASPMPEEYQGKILVPFPLESALSGVAQSLEGHQLLWYRTRFRKPTIGPGARLLLNFGAIDWRATVYVNGVKLAAHSGGYQSFSVDVTEALRGDENELVVSVYDPTDRGPNPHGKQSINPRVVMYTAVSGIWQTVWMEVVPSSYIDALKMTPDVDKRLLHLEVSAAGAGEWDSVQAIVRRDGKVVTSAVGKQSFPLQIKRPRLWSPEDPFLYSLNVRLLKDGKVVDQVDSYFGMRKVQVRKDDRGDFRIHLNDRYVYNLGILDQGYWPDGLYTAPTDEALRFDIEAAKSMGFNTIRKHLKIEPARWYYHCDKIGMLVWQDMPPPGGADPDSRGNFERENKGNIAGLYNHPSIISWVLFNEGGGYDVGRIVRELKQNDPSRLVNGFSGANFAANDDEELFALVENSDVADIHSYPNPSMISGIPGMATVLGEYGGIGVAVEGHVWSDMMVWNEVTGWGYAQVLLDGLETVYSGMIDSLEAFQTKGLSASIYTQLTDVETEQNGLMTYDRRVIKLTFDELRSIHGRLIPLISSEYRSVSRVLSTPTQAEDDIRFAERRREYDGGRRDQVFLRAFAIQALRRNERRLAVELGNTYVSSLRRPYSREDLAFIYTVTLASTDVGFDVLRDNAAEIDRIVGEGLSAQKIRRILEKEQGEQ